MPPKSKSRRELWLNATVFAVGLFVALIGLLNVLPSYGVLPRFGPFPVAWYRPLIFGAAIVTVTLLHLQARHAADRLTPVETALSLAIAAVGLWVCWDYYLVYTILNDSVMFFSGREATFALVATAVTIILCWASWGYPIALLGVLGFIYLATGEYWPGFLQTAPSDFVETVAQNLWYDADQGILGSIMAIILSTVLPFIILGALLEGVGAGESMIRISFHLMRKLRGGPAFAAITASAMFGTVSGSAVANVVGTGVVTIPMIRRRGFSPAFSGAVEATASTGGQILPPIMGAAALVLADYVGVSYLTVIVASVTPALAYYVSLYLAVYFEARKLGDAIVMTEDDTDIRTQDWINLVLVFAPIAIVVWLLVRGMSPAGASIAAIFALFPLSFINGDIRRKPWRLIGALARGGQTVARLMIAIGVVGIIVSVLSATGIPTKFAVLLNSAFDTSLLFALMIAAGGCIILGMGMPTLPAYIAIIVVMGPTLADLGVQPLTAHLFVLFFGTAAGITPPVAIAAYAAAAISGGKPIATAVASTRIGAMIFIIPFAFVFNPILLGVQAAGAEFTLEAWLWAILRLLPALYLCSSGFGGFDFARLTYAERFLRLASVFLLLTPVLWQQLAGLALGLAVVGGHLLRHRVFTPVRTQTR
ncbi:TRAP transporter permease [Oricola thermophila]|uniref:TRAP transporter fused permease subunit n=1 Tax=Oricola thermophila TaxID=2742145 RepID=A0A6N1VDD5_9HYPH|nr:TRAP transporter fused permease subunit [Oricola thermophila]QKV17242.1 TRAP transporter fused permease subunit [Oricola thermophila]